MKRENLAGPPGIEPGTTVLETDVIPLHHRPKWIFVDFIRMTRWIIGDKSKIILIYVLD